MAYLIHEKIDPCLRANGICRQQIASETLVTMCTIWITLVAIRIEAALISVVLVFTRMTYVLQEETEFQRVSTLTNKGFLKIVY